LFGWGVFGKAGALPPGGIFDVQCVLVRKKLKDRRLVEVNP
jgi:hypothetical protein